MFRSFMKDSALYAFPSFVSAGLSLLLIPLYTRVLTPADYGSLDLLLVFANFINLTIALEVSQGIARFYQEKEDEHAKVLYASSGFWFTSVCYAVFLIFSLSYADVLSPLIMGQEGLQDVFQAGMVYIFLNGLFYLVQNQFRWELKSGQFALVSLLMTLVTATSAVSLTYIVHWGLLGLLLGMICGVLAGLLLGMFFLRHTFRWCFSSSKLKEMLRFSSPLVLSGLAVVVTTYIDRVMINHFLSIHEVGLYGIAVRIATVVSLIVVGFRSAFVPLVYKHYKNADTPKQMDRIFRYFIVFSMIVFMLLSVFTKDILTILTTPEFYAAAPVVSFLVLGILLSQMYFFASGIGIAKKTHYFIWINLVGAVVNVALNYWFIPVWGIVGASLATMFSYVCVFFLYMFLSQKHYYVPYSWMRILAATVSLIVLVWIIPFNLLSVSERALLAIAFFFLIALLSRFFQLISGQELLAMKLFMIQKYQNRKG